MKKILWFIPLLSIGAFCNTGFCQEIIIPQIAATMLTSGNPSDNNKGSIRHVWQTIWGTKARDAVLLGAFSYHLDGTGEFFGDGRNNEENHLLGITYHGLTTGTFINSHDNRTWFLGAAREVYSKNFSDNTRFDFGYHFGLDYGYGDKLPNWYGVSGYIISIFGITWKRVGIDLGVLPVGVVTCNFRIDIGK